VISPEISIYLSIINTSSTARLHFSYLLLILTINNLKKKINLILKFRSNLHDKTTYFFIILSNNIIMNKLSRLKLMIELTIFTLFISDL